MALCAVADQHAQAAVVHEASVAAAVALAVVVGVLTGIQDEVVARMRGKVPDGGDGSTGGCTQLGCAGCGGAAKIQTALTLKRTIWRPTVYVFPYSSSRKRFWMSAESSLMKLCEDGCNLMTSSATNVACTQSFDKTRSRRSRPT